jgi:hypothetical protein
VYEHVYEYLYEHVYEYVYEELRTSRKRRREGGDGGQRKVSKEERSVDSKHPLLLAIHSYPPVPVHDIALSLHVGCNTFILSEQQIECSAVQLCVGCLASDTNTCSPLLCCTCTSVRALSYRFVSLD